MDPVLSRKKGKSGYAGFIRDLARRGLVRFTQRPLGECTVFFVLKKSGQLRMIIDARAVNRKFARSPPTRMCTPETFADLEVESAEVEVSRRYMMLGAGMMLSRTLMTCDSFLR